MLTDDAPRRLRDYPPLPKMVVFVLVISVAAGIPWTIAFGRWYGLILGTGTLAFGACNIVFRARNWRDRTGIWAQR